MWSLIVDILKISIPASLVLATAYFLIKKLVDGFLLTKRLELHAKDSKHSFPLKIQAYERLVLLMERISPPAIITRIREENMTAPEFQYALIIQIRTELEHNLAQQLYVSEEAWILVKSAVQETITLINNAALKLPPEAGAGDLARAIITSYIAYTESYPTETALRVLKGEVQQVL